MYLTSKPFGLLIMPIDMELVICPQLPALPSFSSATKQFFGIIFFLRSISYSEAADEIKPPTKPPSSIPVRIFRPKPKIPRLKFWWQALSCDCICKRGII